MKLDYFTQREVGLIVPGREPCQYCGPTGELLAELAALSDRITLRAHVRGEEPELERRLHVFGVPCTVIRGVRNRPLSYYGIPAGGLFGAFVQVLVDASRGQPLLSTAARNRLRRVQDDVHLQVFVTPPCPYSPPIAVLAWRMALESTRIRVEIVEATEFPALLQRFAIVAVPATLINGRSLITGALPDDEYVASVLRAAALPVARSQTTGSATPIQLPSAAGGPSALQTAQPSTAPRLYLPGR